jgi:hypothetical protein
MDSARLSELEQDLTHALQRARQFGKEHGSPEDWNTSWHQQWDNIEGLLRSIRAHVNEMRGAIEGNERDRFSKALEAWTAFQAEDAKLVAGLRVIRAQAHGLNVAIRKEWNLLARTLEPHLEIIHAYGQALRIKLEMLKQNSMEEVERVVQDVLGRLPKRTLAEGLEAISYEQEYQQAFTELQREHHKFLGFMDVVNALLLLVETPDERVLKHRSLRVDET